MNNCLVVTKYELNTNDNTTYEQKILIFTV